MFSPPRSNQFLLITDELAAPADFLLHQFLSTHLKDSKEKDSHCVLVSISEDISRWKAVAAKTNVNFSSLLASGRISYIDASFEQDSSMHSVFDRVGAELKNIPSTASILVILEDLVTLSWMGHSIIDLTRFARALCALCRKSNASLVIRHHVLDSSDPDEILRILLQLCTYQIEVRPLSSGRSGAVSGEIALHLGPLTEMMEVKPISRNNAVLYRLTDTGAIFFERGTGGGVL